MVVIVNRSVDEWEELHQGTDREGLDSPARFDLRGIGRVVQLSQRVPTAPTAPTVPQRSPVGDSSRTEASSEPEAADHGSVQNSKITRRTLVRPYARTGGRTRPRQELALEALVMTTEQGLDDTTMSSPEERFVCRLCVETYSIAEIAAHARLPLGVVKVVVDDLATAGAVVVRQPGNVLDDRHSYSFLTRLLEGLRSL